MAGRIKTPSNQAKLTNVAVVRMKKEGKRFEIACYKNKVLSWRSKVEKDIDEVLQTHAVFTNVSKGQVSKKEDIDKAFGTVDVTAVCKIILEKGELQVSDKERSANIDATSKDVATTIAGMCVNPDTKKPYSVSLIEKGLKEIHFSVNPNKNAKQQALELIPQLRESMAIERAKMQVRLFIPSKYAKTAKDKVTKLMTEVENENFTAGDLELIGLIEPGVFRELDELVHKESKGQAKIELLELRHVSDKA